MLQYIRLPSFTDKFIRRDSVNFGAHLTDSFKLNYRTFILPTKTKYYLRHYTKTCGIDQMIEQTESRARNFYSLIFPM